MAAPYSRDTLDAKFVGLRHEFRADLNAVEGRLSTKIVESEGRLTAKIGDLAAKQEGMQGEIKVWILVLGAVLAVISSGVGNRLLNVAWPADQPGALGPVAPPHR